MKKFNIIISIIILLIIGLYIAHNDKIVNDEEIYGHPFPTESVIYEISETSMTNPIMKIYGVKWSDDQWNIYVKFKQGDAIWEFTALPPFSPDSWLVYKYENKDLKEGCRIPFSKKTSFQDIKDFVWEYNDESLPK